jgi:hypothetical protein
MLGRFNNFLNWLHAELKSRQYPVTRSFANLLAGVWALLAFVPLILFWNDRLIQVFGVSACFCIPAYWQRRSRKSPEN